MEKIIKKTLYRLIYKDGSHGGWTSDKERIEECAKLFNAKIESLVI